MKATLILKDNAPYLVVSDSESHNLIRLEPADAIREFLLNNVPCRLGGRYLYEEDAEADLVFNDKDCASVKKLVVSQDTENYTFVSEA